jgi:hypothetical protein
LRCLVEEDGETNQYLLLLSRIEELAKKMMSKVDEEIAAKKNIERKRHPSEPTPRFNSVGDNSNV